MHRRARRGWLRAASPFLLLLVFAGCGLETGSPVGAGVGDGAASGGSAASGSKVLGITLMDYSNPFFISLRDAAKEEARRQGYSLAEHNAQNNSTDQLDALANFITLGVEAILLNPVDSDAIAPAVRSANEAGIPVVCIDVEARGGELATFVASDNRKLGELCGEYLAERLEGRGKVALVTYPTVTSGARRYEGVKSVLDRYPDVRVVAEQSSGGELMRGMAVAENILTANPELDAIWAINDPTALGCVAAIEAAGLQDRIFVVSVDGSPAVVKAIRAGKPVVATAAQYPQKIGKVGVEMALRAVRGEKLPAFVPIEGSLITAENASSYPGWE